MQVFHLKNWVICYQPLGIGGLYLVISNVNENKSCIMKYD